MKYFTNSSFGLFVSNLSAFLFCLSGLSLCASPFPCHSFPHTPTPIFSPEYITFHTLKTNAHYIACELPELFDGSGAECNHLHPVHQGMAVFLFGKIGLGWMHSFGEIHLELRKEEDCTSAKSSLQSGKRQLRWCNQALFWKIHWFCTDFYILYGINRYRNSIHTHSWWVLKQLSVKAGRTQIQLHSCAHTSVNVCAFPWKLRFL